MNIKKIFLSILTILLMLTFSACASKPIENENKKCLHEDVYTEDSDDIVCHMKPKEIEIKVICRDCGKVIEIQKKFVEDPHGQIIEKKDGEVYCKLCHEKIKNAYEEQITEKRKNLISVNAKNKLEKTSNEYRFTKRLKGIDLPFEESVLNDEGICKDLNHKHMFVSIYQNDKDKIFQVLYICGDCMYQNSSKIEYSDIDTLEKRKELANKIEEIKEYFELTNQLEK